MHCWEWGCMSGSEKKVLLWLVQEILYFTFFDLI